jgi:NUDIX domain
VSSIAPQPDHRPPTPPPTVDLPAFMEAVRKNPPHIVTLCGSTRFAEAFKDATLAETLAGRVVLSIGCDLRTENALTGSLNASELAMLKDGLDQLHFRKIELADEILVLNVGGYIGDSVSAEIDYATDLGKKVRYLEDVCDNTSVAIVITDELGRALVFERATRPHGVAFSAGHMDDWGDVRGTAYAEVRDELGLRVVSMDIVTAGVWRPNTCRRHPGRLGVGHKWWVVTGEVDGDLNPSTRETRNARWATPAELQQLAERTVDYAHGRISGEAFATQPGIEPVQVQWFADAGLIGVADADLTAIEDLVVQIADAGERR